MNATGFRNIVVYDYQSINIKVVELIISYNLNDFYDYIYAINKLLQ
ncbi:HepT-like ribonuclease domain-containing protein [uncultured Clostridium sp.]